MNLIINNPFRILGLPINASEREIAKRISDLAIFAEMGKAKSYETDFCFFPSIQRTPESIKDASNQIQQPENKLFCSLFWFWKNNSVDELVFDLLKDNKTDKAIELWSKSVSGDTSDKNYSCKKNLSILYLGLAVSNGDINKDYFYKGLSLAANIFHDELLSEYANFIAGNNFNLNNEKISKSFVDEVFLTAQPHLKEEKIINAKDLLANFKLFPTKISKYANGRLVNDPMHRVETAILKTCKSRTNDPKTALDKGEVLYESTKDDLLFLSTFLDKSDLQYQVLVDKVANEILQCSIDFFNKMAEEKNEGDFAEKTLRIAKLSSDIAVGDRAKERIYKNVDGFEGFIDDRKKFKRVEVHIEEIIDELKSLPNPKGISGDVIRKLPNTIKLFISSCSISLDYMKSVLGNDDETCLYWSNIIASNALGMCILFANGTNKYGKAVKIMDLIASLDMEPKQKRVFEGNRLILESNRAQAGSSPPFFQAFINSQFFDLVKTILAIMFIIMLALAYWNMFKTIK